MNQDNYCSLEVAQRLVDAGIVLETDAVWVTEPAMNYCELGYVDRMKVWPEYTAYPAPCFAELLQELKKDVIFCGSNLYFSYQLLEQGFYSNSVKFSDDLGRIESPSFISDNPADALAELLIWVK